MEGLLDIIDIHKCLLCHTEFQGLENFISHQSHCFKMLYKNGDCRINLQKFPPLSLSSPSSSPLPSLESLTGEETDLDDDKLLDTYISDIRRYEELLGSKDDDLPDDLEKSPVSVACIMEDELIGEKEVATDKESVIATNPDSCIASGHVGTMTCLKNSSHMSGSGMNSQELQPMGTRCNSEDLTNPLNCSFQHFGSKKAADVELVGDSRTWLRPKGLNHRRRKKPKYKCLTKLKCNGKSSKIANIDISLPKMKPVQMGLCQMPAVIARDISRFVVGPTGNGRTPQLDDNSKERTTFVNLHERIGAAIRKDLKNTVSKLILRKTAPNHYIVINNKKGEFSNQGEREMIDEEFQAQEAGVTANYALENGLRTDKCKKLNKCKVKKPGQSMRKRKKADGLDPLNVVKPPNHYIIINNKKGEFSNQGEREMIDEEFQAQEAGVTANYALENGLRTDKCKKLNKCKVKKPGQSMRERKKADGLDPLNVVKPLSEVTPNHLLLDHNYCSPKVQPLFDHSYTGISSNGMAEKQVHFEISSDSASKDMCAVEGGDGVSSLRDSCARLCPFGASLNRSFKKQIQSEDASICVSKESCTNDEGVHTSQVSFTRLYPANVSPNCSIGEKIQSAVIGECISKESCADAQRVGTSQVNFTRLPNVTSNSKMDEKVHSAVTSDCVSKESCAIDANLMKDIGSSYVKDIAHGDGLEECGNTAREDARKLGHLNEQSSDVAVSSESPILEGTCLSDKNYGRIIGDSITHLISSGSSSPLKRYEAVLQQNKEQAIEVPKDAGQPTKLDMSNSAMKEIFMNYLELNSSITQGNHTVKNGGMGHNFMGKMESVGDHRNVYDTRMRRKHKRQSARENTGFTKARHRHSSKAMTVMNVNNDNLGNGMVLNIIMNANPLKNSTGSSNVVNKLATSTVNMKKAGSLRKGKAVSTDEGLRHPIADVNQTRTVISVNEDVKNVSTGTVSIQPVTIIPEKMKTAQHNSDTSMQVANKMAQSTVRRKRGSRKRKKETESIASQETLKCLINDFTSSEAIASEVQDDVPAVKLASTIPSVNEESSTNISDNRGNQKVLDITMNANPEGEALKCSTGSSSAMNKLARSTVNNMKRKAMSTDEGLRHPFADVNQTLTVIPVNQAIKNASTGTDSAQPATITPENVEIAEGNTDTIGNILKAENKMVTSTVRRKQYSTMGQAEAKSVALQETTKCLMNDFTSSKSITSAVQDDVPAVKSAYSIPSVNDKSSTNVCNNLEDQKVLDIATNANPEGEALKYSAGSSSAMKKLARSTVNNMKRKAMSTEGCLRHPFADVNQTHTVIPVNQAIKNASTGTDGAQPVTITPEKMEIAEHNSDTSSIQVVKKMVTSTVRRKQYSTMGQAEAKSVASQKTTKCLMNDFTSSKSITSAVQDDVPAVKSAYSIPSVNDKSSTNVCNNLEDQKVLDITTNANPEGEALKYSAGSSSAMKKLARSTVNNMKRKAMSTEGCLRHPFADVNQTLTVIPVNQAIKNASTGTDSAQPATITPENVEIAEGNTDTIGNILKAENKMVTSTVRRKQYSTMGQAEAKSVASQETTKCLMNDFTSSKSITSAVQDDVPAVKSAYSIPSVNDKSSTNVCNNLEDQKVLDIATNANPEGEALKYSAGSSSAMKKLARSTVNNMKRKAMSTEGCLRHPFADVNQTHTVIPVNQAIKNASTGTDGAQPVTITPEKMEIAEHNSDTSSIQVVKKMVTSTVRRKRCSTKGRRNPKSVASQETTKCLSNESSKAITAVHDDISAVKSASSTPSVNVKSSNSSFKRIKLSKENPEANFHHNGMGALHDGKNAKSVSKTSCDSDDSPRGAYKKITLSDQNKIDPFIRAAKGFQNNSSSIAGVDMRIILPKYVTVNLGCRCDSSFVEQHNSEVIPEKSEMHAAKTAVDGLGAGDYIAMRLCPASNGVSVNSEQSGGSYNFQKDVQNHLAPSVCDEVSHSLAVDKLGMAGYDGVLLGTSSDIDPTNRTQSDNLSSLQKDSQVCSLPSKHDEGSQSPSVDKLNMPNCIDASLGMASDIDSRNYTESDDLCYSQKDLGNHSSCIAGGDTGLVRATTSESTRQGTCQKDSRQSTLLLKHVTVNLGYRCDSTKYLKQRKCEYISEKSSMQTSEHVAVSHSPAVIGLDVANHAEVFPEMVAGEDTASCVTHDNTHNSGNGFAGRSTMGDGSQLMPRHHSGEGILSLDIVNNLHLLKVALGSRMEIGPIKNGVPGSVIINSEVVRNNNMAMIRRDYCKPNVKLNCECLR